MASGKVEGSSLSRRLQYLRKAGKKRQPRSVPPADAPMPPDWKRIEPFVSLKTTSAVFPAASGDALLPAGLLFLRDREVRIQDLLFYDLETTGLSTGAGVVAFLAGFGRITGSTLTVKQYFMADFPGESAFLQAIVSELSPGTVLVSYNGRTFDRHLLASRFLMNGMRFPPLPEIDLLYASRRLWKAHLPDCTLSTVEQQILGIHRQGDVSGRVIPDLYFSYLRSKNSGELTRVFYHHRQDIITLAFLALHIHTLLHNPAECRGNSRYSLGRYLLSLGKREGEELLTSVWTEGGAFSREAGILLSIFYKRSGHIRKAEAIWEALWQTYTGYFEGIELAKLYEHTQKNYKAALRITETLCTRAAAGGDEKLKGALAHRLGRITRKLTARDPRIR